MHFKRVVLSGVVLFFVAAPLAILWLSTEREPWRTAFAVASAVCVLVAVACVPLDVRRGAFEVGSGRHPDALQARNLALGALLPIAVLAIVAALYAASH